MNAIQYALNNLRFKIPNELLEAAFAQNNLSNYTNAFHTDTGFNSIEANIRSEVIEARVNIDISLKGAMQVAIDLSRCPYTTHNTYTRVYTIPPEQLGGRPIISVQSISYSSMVINLANHSYNSAGGTLFNATMDLYRTVSSMPISGTANLQRIGTNTVLVTDHALINTDNMYMLLTVAHDENLNAINPGLYPLYAELVEFAVKAHIYNKLAIVVGQDYLKGGFTLGKFKEILDNYADANEMYSQIYKEQWGKAQFTNDPGRKARFIKAMTVRGAY